MRRKSGFRPISLKRYVAMHLRRNRDVDRADLIRRLEYTRAAYERDERCQCGEPIWIIGSAEAGLACFTCITGEAWPEDDYEIDFDRPIRGTRRRQRR